MLQEWCSERELEGSDGGVPGGPGGDPGVLPAGAGSRYMGSHQAQEPWRGGAHVGGSQSRPRCGRAHSHR